MTAVSGMDHVYQTDVPGLEFAYTPLETSW